MVMYSLEETMAVRLFFSPLPLLRVNQEAGILEVDKGDAVAMDGNG